MILWATMIIVGFACCAGAGLITGGVTPYEVRLESGVTTTRCHWSDWLIVGALIEIAGTVAFVADSLF